MGPEALACSRFTSLPCVVYSPVKAAMKHATVRTLAEVRMATRDYYGLPTAVQKRPAMFSEQQSRRQIGRQYATIMIWCIARCSSPAQATRTARTNINKPYALLPVLCACQYGSYSYQPAQSSFLGRSDRGRQTPFTQCAQLVAPSLLLSAQKGNSK